MGSGKRLLDRVRAAIRSRHYSRRTEEAYVAWIPVVDAWSTLRRAGGGASAPSEPNERFLEAGWP